MSEIRVADTAFDQTTSADTCFTFLSHNASNWLPIPPGHVTLYSNDGIALVGLIFENYVKENIIKPLGIDPTRAGFCMADLANPDELVNHYIYAANASFLEGWNQEIPRLNITRA